MVAENGLLIGASILLSEVEQTRLILSKRTDAKRKSLLGQFLTPESTARFMAGLFTLRSSAVCRLLDPGAGIGSLSSAFLERHISGDLDFRKIEITAFELDECLCPELRNTFVRYSERASLDYEIVCGDFIEEAVNRLQFGNGIGFTHAILNPPYKKINNRSRHRLLLRQENIETVNLYSAFVALALALVDVGGQVVAIIPRSFCNGPYYRSFRKYILDRSAIRHIHLFDSRSKAFKDDDVLQENIIILLERGGQQQGVRISTSTDDSFDDLKTNLHPFERIVFPDDPERFIHVPASLVENRIEQFSKVNCSLEEIGINVSTGPVVDFRLRDHLRVMPDENTVPLLYPAHFSGANTEWPSLSIRKPNAIDRNKETEKWLYPTGFYCVVRRFSSKEERRRIVASVVRPETFPDAEVIGFENHLNVFHENKQGLPEDLAHGMAAYLNTTAVDENFRRFNGHTQVNATDLKRIKYPGREALLRLGSKAKALSNDQQGIDQLFQDQQE